jgi:hypothetical protein
MTEYLQEHSQKNEGVILLIGFVNSKLSNAIQKEFRSRYLIAANYKETVKQLNLGNIKVLCIGPCCPHKDSLELLSWASSVSEGGVEPRVILVNDIIQEIPHKSYDKSALFYLMPSSSPSKDVLAILQSAANHLEDSVTGPGWNQAYHANIEDLIQVHKLLDLVRDVALQDDTYSACELVTESIPRLFNSVDGYCLNFYARTKILHGTNSQRATDLRFSSSRGILGFVALTGRPARVNRLRQNLHYSPNVDDFGGDGDARLLACAIQDTKKQTLAVLAVTRVASKPAFSKQDQDMLLLLAQCLAAPLSCFELKSQLNNTSQYLQEAMPTASTIYRAKATGRYTDSQENIGHSLQLSPKWTRWVYWLLLLCIGTSLLYSITTKVNKYATGPALIVFRKNLEGKIPVNCRSASGEESRRSNQTVLSSILPGDGRFAVIAFIPGRYGSELKPGMSLRLKLSGYQHVYQKLAVQCIGTQMLSYRQIKHELSSNIAYIKPSHGFAVLVFAALSSSTFKAVNRHYKYLAGMNATAEVTISSQRLLYVLIPGLKHIFERNGI